MQNENMNESSRKDDIEANKEYEVTLSARLRYTPDTDEIKIGWKPISGNLTEVPVMLREYLIGLILSSMPEGQRMDSAGMGFALSKDQVLTKEAATPKAQ